MATAITRERWQEAQLAERKQHTFSLQEGIKHYLNSYHWNFYFCGIEEDQMGKRILEVGPADFPALAYCRHVHGTVVEPMPSEILAEICVKHKIRIMPYPLEDTRNIEIHRWSYSEVWIFNVMQHIINPDLFVEKCKELAPVIRFFEPIDYPTCVYHPHSYSKTDFENWFGDSVTLYTEKDYKPGFHDGPCVYGVWRAECSMT